MSDAVLAATIGLILIAATILDDYLLGGMEAARRHAPIVGACLGTATVVAVVLTVADSGTRLAGPVPAVLIAGLVATRARAPTGDVSASRLVLLALVGVALYVTFSLAEAR